MHRRTNERLQETAVIGAEMQPEYCKEVQTENGDGEESGPK